MTSQAIRNANLRTLVRQLESDGLATREAQASYLGGTVTANALQAMLDGEPVSTRMAADIERGMFKPMGWLSKSHEPSADVVEPPSAKESREDPQDDQKEG